MADSMVHQPFVRLEEASLLSFVAAAAAVMGRANAYLEVRGSHYYPWDYRDMILGLTGLEGDSCSEPKKVSRRM